MIINTITTIIAYPKLRKSVSPILLLNPYTNRNIIYNTINNTFSSTFIKAALRSLYILSITTTPIYIIFMKIRIVGPMIS